MKNIIYLNDYLNVKATDLDVKAIVDAIDELKKELADEIEEYEQLKKLLEGDEWWKLEKKMIQRQIS